MAWSNDLSLANLRSFTKPDVVFNGQSTDSLNPCCSRISTSLVGTGHQHTRFNVSQHRCLDQTAICCRFERFHIKHATALTSKLYHSERPVRRCPSANKNSSLRTKMLLDQLRSSPHKSSHRLKQTHRSCAASLFQDVNQQNSASDNKEV